MTKRVQLREIAHARAGDKGNRSNISVFVFNSGHYSILVEQVTPKRLKEAFGALFTGQIKRYLLPDLYGINLVLDTALEGGVNESLNLDSHGKSWSFLVLGMEVEVP